LIQDILVPFGSCSSGESKTTSPVSGTPPSTRTSDLNPAIRIGGKLTTAVTCLETKSSGGYLFVICAEDGFTPNSPKSISNLMAGLFASGNGLSEITGPTLRSPFVKQSIESIT